MNVIQVRTIVSLLCWLALTTNPPTQPKELFQQPGINREVRITVTVIDQEGRPIGGLLKENFSVLEKKTPEEVTFFAAENPPISIALLIDLSGSMSQAKTARTAEAIRKFATASNKGNHYLLVGFNTQSQLFCEWCSENSLPAAWEELLKYKPRSNTALFDACDLVTRKMRSAPDHRRVVVIVSDGSDNDSKVTVKSVSLLLRQSDVMVYTIGVVGKSDDVSALGWEGQGILADLSSVTGGKAFFPRSPAELDEVLANLSLELANQYVIGFKPSYQPDSKFHEIKINVNQPVQPPARKPPHLSVRYRSTYFNN
jgi:Ca-activated chloride channel family protein